MEAAEGTKQKRGANGGNVRAVAKQRKRRSNGGAAIGKTCEGSKERHQVASSLNCAKSDATSAQTKPKKKRRLKVVQDYQRNCEITADKASSEKEKQSLLAWVELCMNPLHNDSIHSPHGYIGDVHCVRGKSSCMHTRSLPVSSGNYANGTLNKHDASDAHKNAAFDQIPEVHVLKVDHEELACAEKTLLNGHISQFNHFAEGFSADVLHMQCPHEGPMHACVSNFKKYSTSKHANGSTQEMGIQSSRVANGESRVRNGEVCSFAPTHHVSSVNGYTSTCSESQLDSVSGAKRAHKRGMTRGYAGESVEADAPCQALNLRFSEMSSLPKENDLLSVPSSAKLHDNKRKREEEKVLQYVLKRNIVLHPSTFERSLNTSRTSKTVVFAWGRNIPVTLTSEGRTVQEWISSQSGSLFGLDAEWRPNRAKGEKNKVALLQLCNEREECLIIQMLFLDQKPQALRDLLSDPSKSLAGVGVLADGKRLLHDYGLEFQGGIELTTLAVDRLKRDELRNVGLKVLVREVLGLEMKKPKEVTLSNWAKLKLDRAQISYACMDAWASFALSRKLLEDIK